MLQAISQELRLRKSYLGNASIKSIYIGGGTPSILPAGALATLLTLIEQHYVIEESTEVTLEANPDDITLRKLKDLRSIGINRLSIGIQSFQDEVLCQLNRAHNSQQALESVFIANQAGFDNVNIDLIYAIPHTNAERWEADLHTALQLQPAHISAYCLTIEPNTVFGRWKQHAQFDEVEESVAVAQYETLVAWLTNHQYIHYEVSNFCLPERYAKHNMNYWKHDASYLGLGPGAHSYNGHSRQYNIAHNQRYIDSIQRGVVPCTTEILTKANYINEYIMTNLRTRWGCDMAWLATQHGYPLTQTKRAYLAELTRRGLAIVDTQKIYLTTKGMLLADQISLDLSTT